MPVPVPGCLQRIHREHHIPRRHQCHHPRAMTGLDPDPDPGLVLLLLLIIITVAGMLAGQRI